MNTPLPIPRWSFSLALVVLVAGLLGPATGCDSNERPDSWSTVELENQPQLFELRHDHPALAEIEGLYLTQPHDEALAVLQKNYCPNPVRRDNRLGDDAYFLGCPLDDHPTIEMLRVGFWPRLDERVATLEIKRNNVPPAAAYQRFSQLDLTHDEERFRTALIRVETPDYRFGADWDEGLDGPAHLIVGLAPNYEL